MDPACGRERCTVAHLGSGVVRRAGEVGGEVGARRVSEVDEDEPLLRGVCPAQVVELDVAVHHTVPMAVVQRAAELIECEAHLGLLHGLAALKRGAHRVAERAAAAQREHDGDRLARLHRAMHRAHVRVAQLLVDRDLLADPAELLLGHAVLAHHLGRDFAAPRPEPPQVDARCRALTEQRARDLQTRVAASACCPTDAGGEAALGSLRTLLLGWRERRRGRLAVHLGNLRLAARLHLAGVCVHLIDDVTACLIGQRTRRGEAARLDERGFARRTKPHEM